MAKKLIPFEVGGAREISWGAKVRERHAVADDAGVAGRGAFGLVVARVFDVQQGEAEVWVEPAYEGRAAIEFGAGEWLAGSETIVRGVGFDA